MTSGWFDLWRMRQAELGERLAELDAADCQYRADLKRGILTWVSADGEPRAAADATLLCTYALSDRSILGAWANSHSAGAVVSPTVPELADQVPDASEDEAWTYAFRCADINACDAVYRAPNPQVWAFLGLRNVRRASSEDVFVPSSPTRWVVSVLTALADGRDGDMGADRLQTLLRNYANAFRHAATYQYQGTAWAAQLDRTATAMTTLAEGRDAQDPSEALAGLIADAEGWPAS